ncbi:uncharacterized protein LOC143041352 [Oratosquilla oratoria]|uniref:uncharacterized protein LOC143041352 n=1 Tax=Oratosquilla oratoria TaxID=337810 RepID=UPI003F75772E
MTLTNRAAAHYDSFSCLQVELHTNYPMRAVRIWVPPHLVGDYFGLCGVYNDMPLPERFRLRNLPNETADIYEFGNSWKYPEDSTCPDSEYINTCDAVPDPQLEEIKERCGSMLNASAECDYVGDNMDDHMQTCTSDMCACAEAAFDQCIEAIRVLFSEECAAMNFTVPPTPTPGCPTPPPCLCGPQAFKLSTEGSSEGPTSEPTGTTNGPPTSVP